MKVLIIESNPTSSMLIERLVSFYHEPVVCTGEEEAISFFRENIFQVVLVADERMDIQHKIRFLKSLMIHQVRSFKAVVLCQFVDDQIRADLLKGGYKGVLRRPLRIQELNSLL